MKYIKLYIFDYIYISNYLFFIYYIFYFLITDKLLS